jgi:hypothetical protein
MFFSSNQGFSRKNLDIDGLCVLWYVDLSHFLIVIFLIYPLILGWLRIELHNYFFNFFLQDYHDLMTWVASFASQLGWLEFFWSFFLIDYRFFNFIIQHWTDWKLNFIILFNLFLWSYLVLLTQVWQVNLDRFESFFLFFFSV